MSAVKLTFLGTGAAWGLPELSCTCRICREMRERGEKRGRTALLLKGTKTLLIDCGPDIAAQLARQSVEKIDAVLLTHEHGDHYMGLDELFVYKRIAPRDTFRPLPVYVTGKSWQVIEARFGYLEVMGVIKAHPIEPGKAFDVDGLEVFPFKTDHGAFAKGSVGFVIRFPDREGKETRLAYTSDFKDLPHFPEELLHPDYLVIQSFWLNEPVNNRPSHMSFQRAMDFIERIGPRRRTFLVHMGDADAVPGDPSNVMTKKYEPLAPLRSLSDGHPYPIPLCHFQWQQTVDQIMRERKIPFKVTVAHDGLEVKI